jgi:hypothetical protein
MLVKVVALPCEPHLQSILLRLFWRWGSGKLICTGIFLISALKVGRIIGVNHWHPALHIIEHANSTTELMYTHGPPA